MTVFGPDWDELSFDAVKAFLSDAPAEPLEWEAKEDWNPGAIRAAVCGFANSHDGGYLLLGVGGREDGTWKIVGIEAPDSPNAVSDLIANGGVTPYPEGLDSHPFPVADGRYLVVIRVPPVSTPPCLTKGTVFERLSGKTVTVKDASRLASLFERGDAARDAARAKAERLTSRATELAGGRRDQEMTLALGAPGRVLDLTADLFSPEFHQFAYQQIQALLFTGLPPVFPPQIDPSMTQFELVYAVASRDKLDGDWLVCVTRDGAAAVNWKPQHGNATVPTLVSDHESPVAKAWLFAAAMLDRLGLGGSRSLAMQARLAHPSNLEAFVARDGSTGPTEGALKAIEQELRRADGQFVFAEVPSRAAS